MDVILKGTGEEQHTFKITHERSSKKTQCRSMPCKLDISHLWLLERLMEKYGARSQ